VAKLMVMWYSLAFISRGIFATLSTADPTFLPKTFCPPLTSHTDTLAGPVVTLPNPTVSLSSSKETTTLRSRWMISTPIFRILSFISGFISNRFTETLLWVFLKFTLVIELHSSGLFWWSLVKNLPSNTRDVGSIHGLGRVHLPWSN